MTSKAAYVSSCPCCTRQVDGEWTRLCDGCLSAALADQDCHPGPRQKAEPCAPCNGTGLFRARNEPPDDCLSCDGTGWTAQKADSEASS